MYTNFKLSLIILAIFLPIAMQAQTYEMSKRFERSFKLTKTTEINISNKYGNVHLLQWEKDSVRFEVEVNIRSSKEGRVEKLYSEIDVQFSQSPYYANAVSSFAGSGKLWTEISDVTKSVLNAGNEAEINYTVYVPEWAIVKVENRFGNIYATDLASGSEIKLSNGTLQANHLKGKSRLTIAFGNAIIERVDDAMFDFNYAELELQNASKMKFTGKASTAHVGEVSHLQLDSRRDKITVDQLQSLSGTSSFSRLDIGELRSDLLLQTNYGNVKLEQMGDDMQFLQLNASFTSIQLFMTKEQSAGLEIQFSKKAKLSYPQAFKVKEEQKGATESDPSLLKGNIGPGQGAHLKFNLTGGELNILQR